MVDVISGSDCVNWRDPASRKQAHHKKTWTFDRKVPVPELIRTYENLLKRLRTEHDIQPFECLDNLRFAVSAAGHHGLFNEFILNRASVKETWPTEQNELLRAYLFYRQKFASNDSGLKEILIIVQYFMQSTAPDKLVAMLKGAARRNMWDVKYYRFDRAIYEVIEKYDFPIICDRHGKPRFKYYSVQEIELTHDLVGSKPQYTVTQTSGLTTKFTFE